MQSHLLADGERSRTVSTLCLGTMYFGTTVPQDTAFAILDRYVEAGGTFLDTANCYSFWVPDADGRESEELLGRWLASRGTRDELTIATKLGAGQADPGRPYDAHNREGLGRDVVRQQAQQSLRRLGVERLDLLYAHADDRATPVQDAVRALAELVDEGAVGMVAASNYTTWRLALARDVARRQGWPAYCAIQQRHSYVEARHLRVPPPDAIQLPITPELLDYARSDGELTVLAYSPLLGGAYTRADRSLPEDYDTPAAPARLAVLREVAAELGATPNQVVLAWMLGGDPPVLPVIGVSSVAQLDECLAAVDLKLDADQRRRLDEA